MAATFRAGATTVNATGSLTKTTAKPAGTAEDDILVFLSYMHDGGSTAIVWPVGVTELTQEAVPSTDFAGGSAYKVAGGAEPADYTVENDNGEDGTDQFFAIAAVQGADTSDPIVDSAIEYYDEGEGSANVYAPSVEGVTGGLLISVWLHKYDNPGTGTITPPVGMTTGGQGQTSLSATPTPGYSIGAWAWEELDADGPTGLRTATTSKITGDYVQLGISMVIRPAGAATPTADAGPNQTVGQAAQDIQMAGTESGGAGGPYVHTWRIISDTTGGAALSATNVEDPLLDLGPAAGAVTLGYKVEDADEVESAEDTVTITAVGAGAIAVPVADGDVTDWVRVPSGGSIASALADGSDATYGVHINPDGSVTRWWPLSEWTRTPGRGGTLQLRPSMVGASTTMSAELREGSSTVIASWSDLEWTAGTIVQSFPLPITAAEADTIVDPTALRVYVTYEVTAA